MKVNPIVPCLALLLVSTMSPVALGADSPVGTWTWKEGTANHGPVLQLTKAEADKVEGTVTVHVFGHGPGGDTRTDSITDGTYREGVLTFVVRRGNLLIKFTAKLKGDTLEGTYITDLRNALPNDSRQNES